MPSANLWAAVSFICCASWACQVRAHDMSFGLSAGQLQQRSQGDTTHYTFTSMSAGASLDATEDVGLNLEVSDTRYYTSHDTFDALRLDLASTWLLTTHLILTAEGFYALPVVRTWDADITSGAGPSEERFTSYSANLGAMVDFDPGAPFDHVIELIAARTHYASTERHDPSTADAEPAYELSSEIVQWYIALDYTATLHTDTDVELTAIHYIYAESDADSRSEQGAPRGLLVAGSVPFEPVSNLLRLTLVHRIGGLRLSASGHLTSYAAGQGWGSALDARVHYTLNDRVHVGVSTHVQHEYLQGGAQLLLLSLGIEASSAF